MGKNRNIMGGGFKRMRRLSLLVCLVCVGGMNVSCAFSSRAETKAPAKANDLSKTFEYDRSKPLDPKEDSTTKREDGSSLIHFTYTGANNERVPALLLLPKNASASLKSPCIILQHGLGGSKNDFAGLYSTFTSQGYALMMIDAPMHGERANKEFTFDRTFVDMDRTRQLFVNCTIDLRRAMDYLQTRSEIDSKRVGYLGVSMGAVLGTLFAGSDTRVKAPVLIVGGADWKLIFDSELKLGQEEAKKRAAFLTEIGQKFAPIDPLNWVGKISPRPVFMINGDQDKIVPVAANKALHAAAKEPKEVYWYKGGHFPPSTDLVLWLKVNDWLERNVKGSVKKDEPTAAPAK